MKNLDKRIISAVTAFGLAACSVNTGVFDFCEDKVNAETEAVVTDASSVSENASLPGNRKGTFIIAADDEFTATNGILTVSYNDDLSFSDIRLCDSLKKAFTYIKTDVPGKIVIGFASGKPISLNEELISIDFNFATGFNFAPERVNDIDESGCRLKIEELETEDADGTVRDISKELHIISYELRPSVLMGYHPVNYVNAEVSMLIDNNCGFTNGVFSFEYDPEVLEFTEINGGEPFAESMVDSYVVKPGLVKFAVVSDKPITKNGDSLFLKFKVLKDGETVIKGTIDELSNVVSEDNIVEYAVSEELSSIPVYVQTTAPASPAPTVQPTETAPASPVPTVQPTATTPASPVPTVQPTETTPASPEPTVQPTETAPASPAPTLTPPTAKPAEPTEAESFDVDGDGVVNTLDLLKLIKIIIDPTAAKPVTADLTGDGNINAEDIIAIKKLLAQ